MNPLLGINTRNITVSQELEFAEEMGTLWCQGDVAKGQKLEMQMLWKEKKKRLKAVRKGDWECWVR